MKYLTLILNAIQSVRGFNDYESSNLYKKCNDLLKNKSEGRSECYSTFTGHSKACKLM